MDCPEFLARYSDYRDGLITAPREMRRFERHLTRCGPCRRHDAALRHGVLALRSVDAVEPSPGFRARLDDRLRHERLITLAPVVPRRGSVAAALFFAAAFALVALETLAGRRPPARVPELPPVAFPKPVARAGLPLVTFQDPRGSVLSATPTLYGTALVQPAATHVEPATAGR